MEIWGYPVKEDYTRPLGHIVFGDWSRWVEYTIRATKDMTLAEIDVQFSEWKLSIEAITAHPSQVKSLEAAHQFATLHGVPVHLDPSMPENEIHFRSGNRLITITLKSDIEGNPDESITH